MNCLAQISQVLPGKSFTVYIWFSDDPVRLVDVKPLIEKSGVFSKLANKSTFAGALIVMNHVASWSIEETRNAANVISLDLVSSYERSVLWTSPCRALRKLAFPRSSFQKPVRSAFGLQEQNG